MKRAFLGIPVLNGQAFLRRALEAVDYPVDLIVINNNSYDIGFRDALDELACLLGFCVLHQERNLGVAASWNRLIRIGLDRGYDRIFIGSHDTFLKPGSFRRAVEIPAVADVGIWHLHHYDFFCVERQTVQRVGWFDENFFPAYKEDQDFSYRCHLAGLRRVDVPGAEAETIGSATIHSDPRYREQNARTSALNTMYYHAKWGGESSSERFVRPFDLPNTSISWWPPPGDTLLDRDWDRERRAGQVLFPSKQGVPTKDGESSPPPITGVVLARNEERHIADCLRALRPHVGEILLIDMESSDRTVELARPFVAKVIPHPSMPNFDAARNVAIPEANYDWMWFVDADERISERTGRFVTDLIRHHGNDFEIVTIPFKTYFCGKWMQHCGWWPGYTMPRVLKRGHFRFAEKLHGGVEHSGRQIAVAPDPALAVDHFSYDNLEHYLDKLNRYTSVEASQLTARATTFDWRDGIRAMASDLWQYYEHNAGHADGLHGWILSWLSGQYRWISHAKLLDKLPMARLGDPARHVPPNLDAVITEFEFAVQTLRAKRPQLPLGVVLKSALGGMSGYATEGRLFAKVLSAGERPCAAEDLRWSSDFTVVDAHDAAALRLLERCRWPQSSVVITNGIPGMVSPDPRAAINVLRTTFETDRIPEHWPQHLDGFDETWVISEANRRAFRRGWVPPERIRVVPSIVDTDVFSPNGEGYPLPEQARGRFVFLTVLDWQRRKGWDVLLRAYAEEFGSTDGVCLLLKITRGHLVSPETVMAQADEALREVGYALQERSDIVIWEANLREAEMAGLYRAVDCFVLASRGEGWGRPYMEAMASGIATIGTAGSGNADFMTTENSYLIPVAEVEVSEAASAELPMFRGHRWGEPDLGALRRAMREVHRDAHRRREIARRGEMDIRQHFGLDRWRRELNGAIEDIEDRFKPGAPSPSRADQIRVVLEGELFARHSFSTINEVLARFFAADDAIDFSLRRTFISEVYDQAERPRAFPHAHVDRALPDHPHVTIRHAYPPNWSRPEGGKWVHIQPWEFGFLPQAWLEPLRDDVDEIWVPSEYVKRVYVDSGIPAEKVHVIPWGIDPDVFCADVPALILPTEKSFRFLFVGGTIPRKGFDVALDAYLAEFGPEDDVCFVVKDVGAHTFYRGDNFRAKIRTAIESPASPKIVYLDQHLTNGQLASLYRACDCFVAPYRGEGFGLPILEAMACGVPPIVPSGGPTDDFVTSDTGFILASEKVPCPHPWPLCGPGWELGVNIEELRRTMRRACDNREQVRAMAKKASQSVRERFTWEHTYREMRQRIEVLAKDGSAAAVSRSDESEPRGPRESPKLSLCMIVRDNAATLDACLSSIAPWVDEIVVVDTGSVDDTPAIAQRYGAKLFHFPWCDDFSAARNESFRHATGEWLFWMDSDDTIDESNGRRLRELVYDVTDNSVLGIVVQVRCTTRHDASEFTVVDHVKIVRNRSDLRFEGRIHEQILPAIRRAGGSVAWSNAFVTHSNADLSDDGRQRKQARDLGLLHLELEERPEHPFVLFNLGMTYSDKSMWDEAAEFLTDCIRVSTAGESHLRKAYALLVACRIQQGRADEAWQVCEEGQRLFPKDPELRFRRGLLAHQLGRCDDAENCYLSLLNDPDQRHFTSIDQGILGHKTRHNLAILYDELERLAEAEACWRDAVEEAPRFRPAWRGLGNLLVKQGRLAEAEIVARRCLSCEELINEGILINAALAKAAGDLGAVRAILARIPAGSADEVTALRLLGQVEFEAGDDAQAEAVLRRLCRVEPDDPSHPHNLGVVLLRRGDAASARRSLADSLSRRPTSPHTLFHLGEALWTLGERREAIVCWEEGLLQAPADAKLLAALNAARQEIVA